MSIRTKVIGCVLIVLSLFGSVSYYSYSRSLNSNGRLELVDELFMPLSRQIAQVQANVQSWSEDIRRFYFRRDMGVDGSGYSRMARELYPYLILRKFAALETLLAKQEKAGQLGSAYGELARTLGETKAKFEILAAQTEIESFEQSYRDLRVALQSLSARVDEECDTVTRTAQSEGTENLITNLLLSLLVVTAGVVTLVLSHRALMPLPELIASLKKIADGDFDQSLKVRTSDKDEVSVLAREYNRMLAALAQRDFEINRQQNELLQSERLAAVGQLSAEVVHEIRNPLNSISLNIDWLENELRGSNDEVAKTLTSVSREIERLHQITESYLVRARMPAGEERLTEINSLIREILDFSREEDKNQKIAVQLELSSTEILVRSDRSRMKQAFLNVLKNAKEAMPLGGTLRVRTEIADNVSRILVTDSGYGMNESIKVKTFQPFFTTKTNGTGLGLMLTKEIVESAQGTVECESHLGKGTVFTFQFPI